MTENKNWWEKIKEHPIYSKVVAQLIGWLIIGAITLIVSIIYFQSILNFIFKEWIVPTWIFVCVIAVFIIPFIFYLMRKNNRKAYPERVRVIREYTKPHQYIIKNNIVRHIPDPATFDYLGQLHGFDWGSSKGIEPDNFRKFSMGSALPSILPYCQAILEQELKNEVKYESPYYWKVKDGKKDGPFCQCCYDKDHSLIRLQEPIKGYWECKSCNSSYTDGNYQPPRNINKGIL
jgi:hypothetical protein